jgi:hypothetical protein
MHVLMRAQQATLKGSPYMSKAARLTPLDISKEREALAERYSSTS